MDYNYQCNNHSNTCLFLSQIFVIGENKMSELFKLLGIIIVSVIIVQNF